MGAMRSIECTRGQGRVGRVWVNFWRLEAGGSWPQGRLGGQRRRSDGGGRVRDGGKGGQGGNFR